MDYADLREGIYDALCTIAAIQDFSVSPAEGKVFWEWTAPADTEKPFLLMSFLGEIPSFNNKCAMHQQLEVLVLGEATDYLAIDPIADTVVSTLHHQTIITPKGNYTKLCYIRDSRQDLWVEEFRASCIRLKFLIPTGFWI